LEACVGDEDLLLQRAFRHIRSNGYVELQGVDARFESDDGTLDKGPNAKLWMKHLIEACAKFGKPVDCADKWKDRLIKAGFVDVQQEVRKVCNFSVGFCPILLSIEYSCLSGLGRRTQSLRNLVGIRLSKSQRSSTPTRPNCLSMHLVGVQTRFRC